MDNRTIHFFRISLPLALGLGLASTGGQAGKNDVDMTSENFQVMLTENFFKGKPPYHRVMNRLRQSEQAERSVDLFALEIEANTNHDLTQSLEATDAGKTISTNDTSLVRLKKKIGGHPDRMKRY
jgi:hypothetical protein